MNDLEQKKSVFFATSFSGHLDYETGQVNADFKERIEKILAALRVSGFIVQCAMESEDWKLSEEAPGVSMAKNFENIEASDIFVALVDKVGSDGRGIEVEHAYNAGKEVILVTGPDEELSWVMGEVVTLNRAKHIAYETEEELAEKIIEVTSGR